MTETDFRTELQLSAPPHQVFDAINDPRKWWSAQIEGETDRLGGDFVFEVPGIHYSRFHITEFLPDRKVVWHTTEARISFVADEDEWTGTDVVFELEPSGSGTTLRFTHVGLRPQVECYDACSTAWSSYLVGSLARLAEDGSGDPNQERPSGALEDAADDARAASSTSRR